MSQPMKPSERIYKIFSELIGGNDKYRENIPAKVDAIVQYLDEATADEKQGEPCPNDIRLHKLEQELWSHIHPKTTQQDRRVEPKCTCHQGVAGCYIHNPEFWQGKPTQQAVCEHEWSWSNNAGKYYCQKCNDWSYLGNTKNFQVATESAPSTHHLEKEVEELAKIIREGCRVVGIENLSHFIISAGYSKRPASGLDKVKWPEKKEEIEHYNSTSRIVEREQAIGWNACHDTFMEKIKEINAHRNL